jgi:hypothetical protein
MNWKFGIKRIAWPAVGLVIILSVLSGCRALKASPTPEASTATVKQAATLPAAVTSTSAPTSKALLTAKTSTVTPEQPSPVSVQADLNAVRVQRLTNRAGGVLITLAIPNLTIPYNIILAGNKYSCELDSKYPGKLFCWGLAIPPLNTTINLAFLDPQSGKIVLKMTTFISQDLFPPSGSKDLSGTSCSETGQSQSCEMECRVDSAGNTCIVATCFDACGRTYSIQSCPNDMQNYTSCDGQQYEDMKARYKIP